MVRRIVLISLPFLLLAGACSSGGDAPGGADGGTADLGDVDLVAALTPFDSCDALLGHLVDEASDRVGPYGLDGDQPYYLEGDVVLEDSAAAGDATASAGGEALPTAPSAPATTVVTSGTNTQEAFVDEPDTVKTTAERLLVVDDDQQLKILDLTGDEPVLRGSVQLPGWDNQILVVGDRVLALSTGDQGEVWDDPAGASDSSWAPYGSGLAVLSEVDVSDPDAPTITHTLSVEGGYLSARQVGETARVVVSATHPSFPFVYPSNDSPAARRIAEEANRRLVEESTIEDWLPTARLDDQPVDLVDCAGVEQPAEFSGFGFLSVLTVDLTQPLDTPPATTVLADGQTVYASGESLYVATTTPPDSIPVDGGPAPLPMVSDAPVTVDTDYETTLHRFDITGSGAARWLASGTVPGHLLDQYSMSEQDGRLRVATTEGSPWEGSEEATSRVAVLETDGQALTEVGAVEGLGRTEQIYAVRFVGDTAYVVTFRQTDPLFVVDLSDPTNPTLQGELEISGYSAYLHPIDDTHLLGIGQEADAGGMTQGFQASVFDVSDPAHPTRVDQVVLPNEYSDAEYDHHAFLYWAPTGQVALPLSSQASLVLSVGADHVDEQGRIALPSGDYARRNVVVGDHLITVGGATLVTSDLTTLEQLSTTPL